MAGIRPTRTMLQGNKSDKAGRAVMSLDKVRALKLVDMESLQGSFDTIHKDEAEKVTANRAR